MSLKLMLLTSDPQYAIEAQSCGVDRIFFDLEYLNKHERQRGRNTVISNNSVEDILPVREVLHKSELLVRTNPINPHTKIEVDKAIQYGADILMLPMVVDEEDVKSFVRLIDGKAKVCIMVETPQSLARIHRIIDQEGIDEIFIGLNDLHIGMGLTFMFEILGGGLVDYLSEIFIERQLAFGFGGIAKIGEGLLPAENILGEHYRLGSSSVILSRTFKNDPDVTDNKDTEGIDLSVEINKIRNHELVVSNWSSAQFESNRKVVIDKVQEVVKLMESKR